MKTYKITVSSFLLLLPSVFIINLTTGILLHKLIPGNDILGVIILIAVLSLSVYLQQYISKGIVEITIAKNSLSLKWVKQFLFHKNINREIPFSEIKSYKHQEDRTFDLFKLILKDKTEITFWHFTFIKNDAFAELVSEFPLLVNKFNNETLEKKNNLTDREAHKIERVKTIFESSIAPYLAVLAVLLIIGIVTIFLNNYSGKLRTTVSGFAAMSGALFFLAKYFNYRKRSRNN